MVTLINFDLLFRKISPTMVRQKLEKPDFSNSAPYHKASELCVKDSGGRDSEKISIRATKDLGFSSKTINEAILSLYPL
jgi:hypothetical protein